MWNTLNVNGVISDSEEVYRLVYFGGCEHDIRKEVWPFLLGHYAFGSTAEERAELDETSRHYYETTMSEWLAVEAIVRQRDKEKTAVAVAKLSSESGSDQQQKAKQQLDAENDIENDVFEENGYSDLSDQDEYESGGQPRKDSEKPEIVAADEVVIEKPSRVNKSSTDSGNVPDSADEENEPEVSEETAKNEDSEAENQLRPEDLPDLNLDKELDEFKLAAEETNSNKSSPSSSSYETVANDFVDLVAQIEDITIDDNDINDLNVSSPTTNHPHSVIITNASIDIVNVQRVERKDENDTAEKDDSNLSPLHEEIAGQSSLDALQEPKSACVSPASSNGGIYSVSEILEKKMQPNQIKVSGLNLIRRNL